MLIPVTKEHIITADKLATIRELYEFRREGYDYNNQNNPIHQRISELYDLEIHSKSNLLTGILFEICLFEEISNQLKEKIKQEPNYPNNPKNDDNQKNQDEYISRRMVQMRFSYGSVMGKFDDGYDYQIQRRGNRCFNIDVKMYGTKLFQSTDEVQNHHLLVDARQFHRNVATQYIQGFLIESDGQLIIYVAGGENATNLQYKENKNNCYAIPVKDLKPIDGFINFIYQNC